jgi:hypothetical protein
MVQVLVKNTQGHLYDIKHGCQGHLYDTKHGRQGRQYEVKHLEADSINISAKHVHTWHSHVLHPRALQSCM